ncbi:MAG: LysR substrate-binding domain-containing protein, partial [Pseudoclavibacter sp.]
DAGYDPHVAEGELHDLAALLDRLAIDAAVVFDQPADESPSGPLRRTPLFSERFSLIVGSEHPLAHAGPQPLDAFRDTPWILGTSDADPGDAAFVAAARAAGFEPRLGPSSDDYRVVTAYVAAGLGVALVPELALPEGDERPSTLAIVELADLKLTREVSLLTAPTLEPSLVDVMATALTIDPRPIGSRLPIAR